MNTTKTNFVEVKEVIEKKSIIIMTRKDKYNGVLVECISEDELNGRVFLVSVLKMIRKGKRIFVNKGDIVGFIDKSVVEDREKPDKRLIGNILNNMHTAPEVEYLDNDAKKHRRS